MWYQSDLTGQKIGKLTVLKKLPETENGYSVWLCQCDCGGMIKADTRRLKRGTINNCGCVPKNDARKGHIAEDIRGQRFGSLVVLERAENRNGRTAWKCQCDCGNIHIVKTKDLKDGKCKSCGCLKHRKHRGMLDIAGKKIGKLLVEYPIDKRDKKGSVYWHCRCDCGKEIDVSESGLIHGHYRSCGCYREENIWANISNQQHRIDGTSVEILEKRKYRSDNKSGFRGVYRLKNGKYRVGIGFKKKTYYIATTQSLDEAIERRLEVERVVHDGFVRAYYTWKDENEKAPEREKMPFIYDVEKINGEFLVHTNIK